MKLIQNFALVAALATVAMGQTANSGSKPQASPTPVPSSKPASGTKAQAAKTPTGTAKPSASTTASKNSKPAPVLSLSNSQSGAKSTAAKTTAAKTTASKTAANGNASKPAATPKTTSKTSAASTTTGKTAPASGTTPVKSGTIAGKTPGSAIAKTPASTTTQKKAAATSAKKSKPALAAAKPKTIPKAAPKNPKPSVAEVTAVAKKEPPKPLMGAHGRRDPFVSPIRNMSNVAPTSNCTSGKRCLFIPELILQGTVRDISGKMMAVVVTSSKRTYMLRENDQLFNGTVEKITSDSVIFREFMKDNLGRETAHEVVKKLSTTSSGM